MSAKPSTAAVRAAKAELRRRALAELRERDPAQWRTAIVDAIIQTMTRKQREVLADIDNGIRYLALCCGRRAGKTTLLAKLIVIKLLRAGHNEAVFYVAESLKIGKGLIWKEIERIAHAYFLHDVAWKMAEHLGVINTDSGAAFMILGLNKEKQAGSTRGFKAILFCIDECQNYEHLLEPTIIAVSPALADMRGTFVAAGTPGWSEEGTWHDVTQKGKHGFKAYNWTVRDNERFPRDVDEMLADERKLKGYDEDHPDYLREWLGIWAKDVSKFLCEFLSGRNTLTLVPETYGLHWRHVMGMDFGWDDAITWVVVAVNPFGHDRIVVWAQAESGIDNDEAAEITASIAKRFGTKNVVCDPAGGGKAFFEGVFNRKYGKKMGLAVRAAHKLGKVESVKAINTELRTGRLKLLEGGADDLAKELRQLRWKDRSKAEVLTTSTLRDDCFDGFRYAMVEVLGLVPREEPANDAPGPMADIEEQERKAAAEWAEKVKTDASARERERRNREVRGRQKTSLFGGR